MLAAGSEDSPTARREYLESVNESLRQDDVNTVVQTVKHIDQLRLSEPEYTEAVANLCHIKRDPATEHVWGEVRANLINYHEVNSFNCETPDQICR